ncbi:MAG TPA: phosphatidate cytidylyltransferase [Hyphomicrobiaceae bacterium]|nr:phosphatidate cytidylyltransferase [Hyphomicrobiaceae bacterium]
MSERSEPGGEEGSPRAGLTWLGSDFTTRLVSGLVMVALAAAALIAGPAAFNALVFVLALLLSWEWGRLVHGRSADTVIAVHIAATALAVGLAALGFVGLGLLALPIGAIVAMLLSLGRHSVFAALGVFYAALPAVILIWLRSDPTYGLRAAVYVILLVIAADTGAFLAGRGLAGPKLWPSVSPNKTWAGLLGGILAGGLTGALMAFAVPGGSALRLGATAAVLAFLAQMGDLMESAIKRRFGAKDTSALIPGHGGVMDRVDGLVIAATAAGLAGFFINVHSPARALLLGY